MNKARITYRMDESKNRTGGEGRQPQRVIPLYEEEFHIVQDRATEGKETIPSQGASAFSAWRDPQAVNPYPNDYGAWQMPAETEADRVERAIRETEERRGQPQAGSQYDTVQQSGRSTDGGRVYQPPETPVFEAPDISYRTNNRQPNTPWVKLTVSVMGAALTGVILGFFVLQMFSANGKKDGQEQDLTNTQNVETIAKTDANAGVASTDVKATDKPVAAAAGAQSSVTGAVNLPGRTFTFIQAGSFSTQQSADTGAAELQKKGYAAVVEKADQYKVYIGMAQSRDKALALSQQLKQQKTDVILKDYSIAAVSAVKWNGKADALKTYITETDKLIGTISTLTLLHLEEAKPTAIDDTTMQSLKSAHAAWSNASSAAASGTPEEGKAALQKMNSAVNSAKKSLDEYKKAPSAAMLWNAQSYIMQCSLAEKELLTALAVK